MLERPIQRVIPKAEDLLRMTSQQLAPILLKLAREQSQQSGFVPGAVSQYSINEAYPGWKKNELDMHLGRAWNWLSRKGLIEPSPGMNGDIGWRMLTEEGEAVANGADIEAVQTDFPRALLHKAVIANCESLVSSGHYAQAVEMSFRVVRDRLRHLTSFEKGADAFGKGNLHVKGAINSHVDEDFNEAVKFLTMAIDRFRNEKVHTAEIGIDDPIKAFQYLILSSLAMRLLDNVEIVGPA